MFPFVALQGRALENMETVTLSETAASDSNDLQRSRLTPTGVVGLDELLGGGIPTGRSVLILGEPGAGKTTLCSHFLANGYLKFGENGVYVSLEENRKHLFREMAKFGINFDEAEKKKQFVFVDASPIRHVPSIVRASNITIGKKEFSLVALMDSVKRAIDAVDAKRVVIDPLSYLIFQYTVPAELRGALLDLMDGLTGLDATVLMASELKNSGSIVRGTIQMEEYVAHGTIIMQSIHAGTGLVRVVQVQKMRECEVDRQPRPYVISKDGIVVYPKENVY
jgi:KaiC/GvpD/RAD55 family RecA-like ATPase